MEKKWSPLEDIASFPGVCFFLHVILVLHSSSLCLKKYFLEGNFPLKLTPQVSDLSLINQKIILPTDDFSLNSYNQYCYLYILHIAFDSYLVARYGNEHL